MRNTSKLPKTFILLFFFSGTAALVYEIVWFQFLRLTIGASAVSLGILLASYMGGLLLGSACFPRLVSSKYHPLRVYGFLELLIGLLGLGLPAVFPIIQDTYYANVGYGLTNILYT